jgi:quercetin dioxygenase-like cupin family protein
MTLYLGVMNRRDTLLGLLALASTKPALGASETWPDAVLTLENSKAEKHDFGEVTVFYDGKTGQLKSLVTGTLLLYPGQEPHPPHQHPEEEIMIMTEGHGTILVNGKNVEVGPGSIMYCEANRLHGVKNTSSKPFRFYYMKFMA